MKAKRVATIYLQPLATTFAAFEVSVVTWIKFIQRMLFILDVLSHGSWLWVVLCYITVQMFGINMIFKEIYSAKDTFN